MITRADEVRAVAGFEALIEIDGKRVDEYNVEVREMYLNRSRRQTDATKRSATCLIESREGVQFRVHFRTQRGADFVPASWRTVIDGQGVGRTQHLKQDTVATREYVRLSPQLVQPFVFAKTRLTDNDDHVNADEARNHSRNTPDDAVRPSRVWHDPSRSATHQAEGQEGAKTRPSRSARACDLPVRELRFF